MNLIIDNSTDERFRMTGVERTFFEAIIHEQAGKINREYLSLPETLKIEDRFKNGFQIIISVFNKTKKRKEKYAVNVSAGRLSLNSFEPVRKVIINLS